MKSKLFNFTRSVMAVAAVGTAMMAMPAFAQNTIKIGMITDKVGEVEEFAFHWFVSL